jgi:hypothetical protein
MRMASAGMMPRTRLGTWSRLSRERWRSGSCGGCGFRVRVFFGGWRLFLGQARRLDVYSELLEAFDALLGGEVSEGAAFALLEHPALGNAVVEEAAADPVGIDWDYILWSCCLGGHSARMVAWWRTGSKALSADPLGSGRGRALGMGGPGGRCGRSTRAEGGKEVQRACPLARGSGRGFGSWCGNGWAEGGWTWGRSPGPPMPGFA